MLEHTFKLSFYNANMHVDNCLKMIDPNNIQLDMYLLHMKKKCETKIVVEIFNLSVKVYVPDS